MNIPITLSVITINPGDIAIGDDDGLFVFSEDYAHSIHQAAQDKEQQDKAVKEALLSKFLSQINEIEPI